MERRKPRYFSLLSHTSFIYIHPPFILVQFENIAFDLEYLVQCPLLIAHALTFLTILKASLIMEFSLCSFFPPFAGFIVGLALILCFDSL
jgi:hypothetical protein